VTDHLWYPEIAYNLARTTHLFLHMGAFHRVDADFRAVTDELTEAGFIAERFDLVRRRPFAPAEQTDVALITGMEALIDQPRALERLRVAVNEWIARSGGRVLVLSGVPRSSFPIGDGSSLLLDCRDLHLHSAALAEWHAGEAEANGMRLPERASESRALCARLLLPESDPTDTAVAIAGETIFEMGANYISLLEEWCLELNIHSVPTVDVPEWMQVELVASGIARFDLDQRNILLFDRGLGAAWAAGLRAASRRMVRAPRDWRETAAGLFEIERTLRRHLSEALQASLGQKWAKQVLKTDLVAYIRASAGVPSDFPLERLANPLDYLTLAQLLDFAQTRDEARTAGFSAFLLDDLRRLIPIRNRMGHMRLPRTGDLHAVRSSLRLVQLSTS
jgi:hypothetical protein